MTSHIPQNQDLGDPTPVGQILPGETAAEAILRKAKAQYRDISDRLSQLRPEIFANDDKAMRDYLGVVQTHWKALQTVLDKETDLEKSDRERAGIAHGYAIDLDAARSEVGRRLACLKNAAAGEGISGGVE